MSLEFLSPWAFWFLLVIPFIWLIKKIGIANLSNRHLRCVALVRSICILFLVIGIAQPILKVVNHDPSVVFLVDTSSSISPSFISNGLNWINQFKEGGFAKHIEVVMFADTPARQSDLNGFEGADIPDVEKKNIKSLNLSSTNLERAVNFGVSLLDRDSSKRLVLLTDGNETSGNVWRTIGLLKKEKVKVHAMIPKVTNSSDAWIASLATPPAVRDSELFVLTVRVYSPDEAKGEVELLAEGSQIGKKIIALQKGMNDIDFEVKFSGKELVRVIAKLSFPKDPREENNLMESTVWVDSKPQLLFVASKIGVEETFVDTLIENGFSVDRVTGDNLPENVNKLNKYDVIFMSNIAKDSLSDANMSSLMAYVRDYGGGVVFASGENVFGENGYSGTIVEEFLPVEFKARERKKDLALVIAIDRSYSMKGRKIEYAKEASRAALDLLEEQHKFAVVAFDSQPYISVPMRMVRSKRRAEDRISRIKASGQTNIYPALGVVYRLLQREKSVAKHVILLSDGDTHPADFEKLLSRIKQAGIVVSTVTIGKTGDPELMARIADWGGGQNHIALSAEAIPQIFIEETQKALNSTEGEQEYPVKVELEVKAFSGIQFDTVPKITGLVSTKLRDTADILLTTADGEPLLSRWQYGLGKSVSFSSTISGKWAENWVRWDDYAKFWDQILRDTMRNLDTRSTRLRVLRNGKKASAKIVLLDGQGRFRNNLKPVVNVRNSNADDLNAKIPLQQVGPGSYEALITEDLTDRTTLSLLKEGGVGALAASRAGVVTVNSSFPDELRSNPSNFALLGELAGITGGSISPTVDEIFSVDDDLGVSARALMPWMVGLSLLFFLFDIYLRRSPFAWRILGKEE